MMNKLNKISSKVISWEIVAVDILKYISNFHDVGEI